MSPKTLTRTEGYTLTDARTAVRLSVDVLQTRTATYAWDAEAEVWVRPHTGLRVVHCRSGRTGQGWHWARPLKKCVRCHCDSCG